MIWYDSVIDTGELKWQDELNLSNKDFLDASDGVFGCIQRRRGQYLSC